MRIFHSPSGSAASWIRSDHDGLLGARGAFAAGTAQVVFDSEGVWIGTVTTPVNVTVLEIGTDYLLGRHRDELGVERVVLDDLDR